MSNVKYQVQVTVTDPFDIMCGEGPEHEITYFEDITLEELREMHEECLGVDACMTELDYQMYEDMNGEPYQLTNPDFDAWLAESIDIGYIQILPAA